MSMHSVSIVGLNAGDVAFLWMGIHLFPFFCFTDIVQEKSHAFRSRCWRLSGMWCQMPELPGNGCNRGTSNVCAVSRIPISFNIALHYKWRFFKNISSTPANILWFSSVTAKQNKKKEWNKGSRTAMGSYPHFIHAFISLKGVWYSSWKIMTSLSFKQIVPGKWTGTWYTESNLSYCFFCLWSLKQWSVLVEILIKFTVF